MTFLRRPAGLRFGQGTDSGRVREKNEDCCAHHRQGGRHLLIVADGMGGEVGGHEASRTAVAAVRNAFARSPTAEPRRLLEQAIADANQACLARQQQRPELRGMGTTLEVVIVEGEQAWWAHVGDGRIYFLHDGLATQLTSDHTLVHRLVEDGLLAPEDAAEHPQRHVLSRVVGRKPDLEPDVAETPVPLHDGDAIVLCSDGLADQVRPDEIAWAVKTYNPGRACRRLIALANRRGGTDNVTVQVVCRGTRRRR